MKIITHIIRYVYELPNRLKIIIFSSFMIPFGSFMILPFIPIILLYSLKLKPDTVGIILAITTLIQFGGGFIGGLLGHKFGLKRIMITGLSIRTLGLFLLTLSYKYPSITIISILLIMFGAAIYLPSNKAYIVVSVKNEKRTKFLSLSSSSINLGMAVGPLIGGLLVLKYPLILFSLVTIIFIFLLLIHILLLPKEKKIEIEKNYTYENKKLNSIDIMKKIALPAIVAFFTFYFLISFVNYMGPYTKELYSAEFYSILLLINAIIIVIFQPILANKIRDIQFYKLIILSFSILAISFFLLSIKSYLALILGVIFLSFSEALLLLKIDLEFVNRLPNKPSVAFAYQRLVSGFGASTGSIIGGYIYGYSLYKVNSSLMWHIILFQILIFIFFMGIYFIKTKHN